MKEGGTMPICLNNIEDFDIMLELASPEYDYPGYEKYLYITTESYTIDEPKEKEIWWCAYSFYNLKNEYKIRPMLIAKIDGSLYAIALSSIGDKEEKLNYRTTLELEKWK